MSTKATIILSGENEHIYWDCAEPVFLNNEYKGDGITFEFELKNIDYTIDDECLTVWTDKYSDLWSRFNSIFMTPYFLREALNHIKQLPEEHRNIELENKINETIKNINR